MPILYRLRALAGAIPRWRFRRQARRFFAATADCRSTQHGILRDLMALNGDSRYFTERRLNSVRTVDDLRRAVSVTSFDDYAPYVEDMKQGDHQALLGTRNPLLMFSLSSGTTSNSKHIPITKRFLRDYRRGWQTWGIKAFDDHPEMNARNIVQLSSDFEQYRTPGGTPCGNISGLVAAMQKRAVQTMYTVPGVIGKIKQPESKSYTALRLALADEQVGLLMTANPSTLLHLIKLSNEFAEDLIRDIADGTLSSRFDVPAEIRAAIRRRTSRRRPARARELQQLVDTHGELKPSDYWPGLQLIAVWTGGSVGSYLHSLRRYCGHVGIRDHGLSASEGRMTIPIENETSNGILDVTSHFFEFIPEEEYESEHPTVLEAHELQEGRSYFILLTTSSGFCRYDICDVVRCTGFYNTTPMLEFLHKGAHIANLTGEKISESQVVEAVTQCVEQMDIDLKHYTVAPVWDEPPRYQLIAEQGDFHSAADVSRFVRRVDMRLQRLNCEYHEKRRSGRLGLMTFLPLPDGAWAEFTRKRQQKLGGSLEQYKHPCLVPDLKFSEQLLSDIPEFALPVR